MCTRCDYHSSGRARCDAQARHQGDEGCQEKVEAGTGPQHRVCQLIKNELLSRAASKACIRARGARWALGPGSGRLLNKKLKSQRRFFAVSQMAPHLAGCELDSISGWLRRGLATVEIHAKLSKERATRGMCAPDATTILRAVRGATHRRGIKQTRGAKKKLKPAQVHSIERAN